MPNWEETKNWWLERPLLLAFVLAVAWVLVAVVGFFTHWLAGTIWIGGSVVIGIMTAFFYLIIMDD